MRLGCRPCVGGGGRVPGCVIACCEAGVLGAVGRREEREEITGRKGEGA